MPDRSMEEAIYRLLADLTGREREEMGPETELVAGLGIDSPLAAQLRVELEEVLGVELSDEEATSLVTIGDLLELATR